MKTVLCAAAFSLLACGGKQAAKPTETTAPTGGTEAPAAAVNGCTTYKDMTEAGADAITWDESVASSDMRCVKIKVDSTVGFRGNFKTHPMKAENGDAPNPFDTAIASISNPGDHDEQTNVVFPKAGTFGYVCSVHPSMTGAVMVVP